MGVHSLWRLLDCVSRPTTTDEWRGKVVAVDASVWMAQFRSVSSQRRGGGGGGRSRNDEDDGGDHTEDGSMKQLLEGFVNRILKLFYFGITPVIVFDGPSSQLKAREKERRRLQQQQHHHDEVVRRARRIVAAQVSMGILDDAALAALPHAATARGQRRQLVSPRKRPLDAHKDGPRVQPKSASSPSRRFRARRKRKRSVAVVIAPERISKELTRSYLSESGVYLKSKHQGDATNAANLLRSTTRLSSGGSSLFLGSRSVLESSDGNMEQQRGEHQRGASLSSDAVGVAVDGNSPVVVLSDGSAAGDASDASSDGVQITACKSLSWLRRRNHVDADAGDEEQCSSSTLQERWSSTNTTLCRTSTSTTAVTVIDSSDDETNASTGTSTPGSAVDGTTDMEPASAPDGDGPDGFWSAYDVAEQRSSCTHGSSRTVWHLDDNDDSSNSVVCVAPMMQQHPESGPVAHPVPAAATASAAYPATAQMAPVVPPIRPSYRHTDVIPLELLDLVELLRLCGVPYVISPAEADAQCAYLNACGLVDAVFTEDSDVVVHGAHTVLRGFFTQAGVTAVHKADLDACGVTRSVLLTLAQLLGCDYAPGVGGMPLVDCMRLVACLAPPPLAGGGGNRCDGDSHEAERAAVVASLWTLQRWTAIVRAAAASCCATDNSTERGRAAARPVAADAIDDLSIAQRAVVQGLLLRGKWAKWIAPLVDGGAAATASSSKYVLPHSFPDPKVSLMFTRQVPVDNCAIAARPAMPQPDWHGLGRFLSNRGLPHLWSKAELARRAMETRALTAHPALAAGAAGGGSGHANIAQYLTVRRPWETANRGVPGHGLAALMALRPLDAHGRSSQGIWEALQLMEALLTPAQHRP